MQFFLEKTFYFKGNKMNEIMFRIKCFRPNKLASITHSAVTFYQDLSIVQLFSQFGQLHSMNNINCLTKNKEKTLKIQYKYKTRGSFGQGSKNFEINFVGKQCTAITKVACVDFFESNPII